MQIAIPGVIKDFYITGDDTDLILTLLAIEANTRQVKKVLLAYENMRGLLYQ